MSKARPLQGWRSGRPPPRLRAGSPGRPSLFSYMALSLLANHKQGPLPGKGKHISLGTFSDMHAKLINMGRHASSRPAPHPRVHANKASPCPGDLHKALLLI